MDYFGSIVDDLCDLWEDIKASPHAEDGAPVLKALERAMRAASAVERRRNDLAAAQALAPTLNNDTLGRLRRERRAA